MPDKVYVANAGFVQFDPQEREANGQKVLDFTIKCFGKPVNVRVTLWPELEEAVKDIKKGTVVFVEGTFTTSTYQDQEGTQRTSNQINAYNVAVLQSVPRKERDVVSESTTDADDLPF